MKKSLSMRIGEITGFIAMFFISSTVFYILFKHLDKLPANWKYFNVLLVFLLITLTGIFIKLWME